jgi:hypothetical protein
MSSSLATTLPEAEALLARANACQGRHRSSHSPCQSRDCIYRLLYYSLHVPLPIPYRVDHVQDGRADKERGTHFANHVQPCLPEFKVITRKPYIILAPFLDKKMYRCQLWYENPDSLKSKISPDLINAVHHLKLFSACFFSTDS